LSKTSSPIALALVFPLLQYRVCSVPHVPTFGPMQLLSYWMLHWWRINSSTDRDFLCTHQHRARGWTGQM